MKKQNHPKRKEQVNFLAPQAVIDRAEALVNKQKELAEFGDEIAAAFLGEHKRLTETGKAIQGTAEPTGEELVFPLLLSPEIHEQLIKAACRERRVNLERLGTELLTTWESKRIESYATGKPMPDGSPPQKSPIPRGLLWQTQIKEG